MEYLLAIVIFAAIFLLTTVLSGFLGLLIPISYVFFGFILGTEYIIIGFGGLLGNLLNYYITNKYIKTNGAMSNSPRYSRLASAGFILVFVLTIFWKYALNFKMDNINYWYILIFVFFAFLIIRFFSNYSRTHSLRNFNQSVVKYKIVEKYDDNPKWATYLYFDNGKEGWNQTIPGSWLAKNPDNDLTFVHLKKEDALRYAKNAFESAEYLEN